MKKKQFDAQTAKKIINVMLNKYIYYQEKIKYLKNNSRTQKYLSKLIKIYYTPILKVKKMSQRNVNQLYQI